MAPRKIDIAAALVALTFAGPTFAADEALERLDAKVETCLRAEAPNAERFNPTLSDAAQFLLQYLCARDVEVQGKYVRNTGMLTAWRSMTVNTVDDDWPTAATPEGRKRLKDQQAKTKEAYAKAFVDPDSGELVMPKDMPAGVGNILEITYSSVLGGETSSHMRALAGRAVLEARLARLKLESAN